MKMLAVDDSRICVSTRTCHSSRDIVVAAFPEDSAIAMESHRAFGRAAIFSASGIRSFTANGMDLMS
jgi:hypothetical protein